MGFFRTTKEWRGMDFVAGVLTAIVVVFIVFPFFSPSPKVSDYMTVNGRPFVFKNNEWRLQVGRTIHKDFKANWTAELKAENANGSFSNICSSSGTNDYTTDEELPDDGNPTVAWWTHPKDCQKYIQPNKLYIIDTSWAISDPSTGEFVGTLRVSSQVFRGE